MRKPKGIDERPEQLRPPIEKHRGTTTSERYLAKLSEKTFLNLWSYPSPFRDQRGSGSGDGKELCDLLVVCDNDIIIFSEKTIAWPKGDLNRSWHRWSNRAIHNSVKQANGAERWITEYPERIYLDRKCKVAFPINFPNAKTRRIHKIIVARGASENSRKYFPRRSGSLVIRPGLKSSDHWPRDVNLVEPFTIGDIDPLGAFVHVFDEISLDIVMSELDTIRDFTDYLEKKENFVRSGKLRIALGEENLLSYYSTRINKEGDHDFVVDDSVESIEIGDYLYDNYINDPRYLAKQDADRISYIWDALIISFTTHMLDGTSITRNGEEFDLRKYELSVRHMALVRRYIRRAHGEAIDGALKIGKNQDRFFRLMIAPEGTKENETAFFILLFKYFDWMENYGGYEAYRAKRTECCRVYALGILERFGYIERVVGIACEPPGQGRGGSEDLVYAEQAEWSDQDRLSIQHDCKAYGVLQNQMKPTSWSGQEFPEIPVASAVSRDIGLNRNQRRAKASRSRRKK